MGRIEIKIPYKPRDWSKVLHKSDKRWNVVVAHRRCGKTVACLNHLIRASIITPSSKYAYICPTYKQAKNVAWDYLKYYSRPIPNIKINESELKIDYPNDSRVQLYGADNPDSLRGLALWGVVFDEYSQQPSNVFTEIISPALSDNKGWAIWIGTPKGKNAFWELYNEHQNDPEWLVMHLKATETGILPDEELKIQADNMSIDEFKQEYECSFEASVKGSYYGDYLERARTDGRVRNVPYDAELPVHTVWDLGIGDATSILFVQVLGKEVRIIDYYENNNQGLPFYKKILDDQPYTYGKHFAPHDIEVRELTTGKSRLEIAKSLGLNFQVMPKLTIADGIEAGRVLFSRLYIDQTKCSEWLNLISQYRKEWDDKRGCFKTNPLHDWTSHGADAYRGLAVIVDKLNNNRASLEQRQRITQNRERSYGFR